MPKVRSGPPFDGRTCDVAEIMGQRLSHLVSLIRRQMEQRLSEHGLTDAQWKPLWFIRSGHNTVFDVARETEIDPGAMTRLLDRLEAKGLIERERSDIDRRVVHLRLTRDGEAVAQIVPYVLADVNNDFLRGFSVADWKQLSELIERMIANGLALHPHGGGA